MLQRWEVIRVHRPHLLPPHDKFCVVIDEAQGWFLYINSNPPAFRKARALAVEIENFEGAFLHHNSFVDTTSHETLTPEEIAAACAEPDRLHGFLALIPERSQDVLGEKYTVIFCILHNSDAFSLVDLPFMSRYELMLSQRYLTEQRKFKTGVVLRKVEHGSKPESPEAEAA